MSRLSKIISTATSSVAKPRTTPKKPYIWRGATRVVLDKNTPWKQFQAVMDNIEQSVGTVITTTDFIGKPERHGRVFEINTNNDSCNGFYIEKSTSEKEILVVLNGKTELDHGKLLARTVNYFIRKGYTVSLDYDNKDSIMQIETRLFAHEDRFLNRVGEEGKVDLFFERDRTLNYGARDMDTGVYFGRNNFISLVPTKKMIMEDIGVVSTYSPKESSLNRREDDGWDYILAS